MSTIGRYQLVEKLGQGGMGVVYRAFDPLLQRVVAVKLIGAIETNDELRERFFREARAAGQLSHKNIITIYDLGEHEGKPFLAMEFLEGQDLQQRMAAHVPMTLSRKLELAIEMCEGLEYAHSHSVIHRDIKPANIFITTGGTAKILDFGLARIITSELTNSNMMMGTLNYMAPEQVRGERADHRSDIFSTGVVLYEMLGGKKAFEGDSFGATLYKILQEEPEPLPNLDPSLPSELIAVVDRALVKTREERYQTMTEMLQDLTAYRQQLLLANSPTFGLPALAPDAATMPRTPVPSSKVLTPRSGSPPLPSPSPVRPRSGASSASNTVIATPQSGTTAPPPRTRHPLFVGAAVATLVLVVALVAWTLQRNPPASAPPANPSAGAPPAASAQQDIASRLEQASKALQAGNGAEAQRQADAVLAISPGHPEARRLRESAQQASATVSRSLSNARSLFAAGRYDEASRAAGEVLAVDPKNAEAKKLMEDGAARSRGQGAEEARGRMTRAKNAAASAGAMALASVPYSAALAAERDAASLYRRGRLAEAMSKYWEASGLFRSAEIAAQTEAAARTARARTAQAERKPAEPAPQAPPTPTVPAASNPNLQFPSNPAPVAPPAPPPPVPLAAATQPPAPAENPNAGIQEVLERYKGALESRNLEALKRIWPALGGAQESAIRDDFRNANRISVEIASPQITASGSNATVTFLRRYHVNTIDGQRLSTDTRTTMTLHRSASGWVIDTIRFEPVR